MFQIGGRSYFTIGAGVRFVPYSGSSTVRQVMTAMADDQPSDIKDPRSLTRPKQTVGPPAESVDNAAVTCRSAENHVERQLADPAN